jgi:ribosomal protein L11 methyltransferase
MSYLALSIDLGSLDAERVEAACFAGGALSVTLSDSRDDAILEPALGTQPLWPSTRLQALYPEATDAALLKLVLSATLEIEPGSIHSSQLADRVWEREWLRDFKAMRFGRRLWVCPHHERVTEPNARIVSLDPGLAFGTGTHPSTALCLEWLDKELPEGAQVLDFGCGSGILALAAARLGAGHVVAYDIDPQALLETGQNAAANGLSAQISICATAAELPARTEIILANILAGTLEALAEQFARQLQRGGRVLLAGILADQADAVTGAYAPWFDIRLAGKRQEWVALEGIRSGNVHGLS